MKKVTSLWSRLADVAALVATPLTPADYVALVRPHARQARVEAVHDEAPGVRTLTLRPARGWPGHRPGQHVRIGLAIDGRVATRTYSISSAPDRHRIAITVKAQGRVSRALVHDVEPGTFLTLGPPAGEFVLDDPSARPLFVTGGSGITPIASMLRAFAARGEMPDVAHVHFARSEREAIFGAELRRLAAAHPSYRLAIVPTGEDPRRLDAQLLDELAPDWHMRETWACGPQPLLDALASALASAGRAHALHVERFRAALQVLPNACGGRVRFDASNVSANTDGRTPLLQVAEAAGLCPPSGCRMGICHTCDVTLTSGRVRDLRTGVTLDEPGARIQLCVCAAAGDVELAL